MPTDDFGGPEETASADTHNTAEKKGFGTADSTGLDDTTAASRQQRDDIIDYVCAVTGAAQGWVGVAFGVGPYRNDNGKIRFRFWLEGFGRWPDAAEELLALMLEFSGRFDAYLCPYPLSGPTRKKATSVYPDKVHADVDGGRLDVAKVRSIRGACAVNSGTPGNGHVYVLLTRSVLHHQHEQICRGLMRFFGAEDSKVSDNDVLRAPGCWNHKPRVDGGLPLSVTWAVRPDGRRIEPEELAALLDVELTDAPPPPVPKAKGQNKSGGGGSAVLCEVEPFDLARYPQVWRVLATVTGDRSADTMRVVGACARNRLTEAQARWAVRQREDLAERLDGRHDDDVARCFGRAYKAED